MNDTDKVVTLEFNRATYGEVIRAARVRKGLTQPQLAKALNIHKNYVSNWEIGKARPDLNIIPELCDVLGITPDDFFGRAGISGEDRALLNRYHMLSPANRTAVKGLINQMLDIEAASMRSYCQSHFIRIRHEAEKMSAGYGNPLSDGEDADFIYVRASSLTSRADTVITVWGDSMEPRFHDGDEALVQFCDRLRPGEIGVFIADGESYIKEYQQDGLHSLNPAYPTRYFYDDDNTRVVGRVLGTLNPDDYPDDAQRKVLDEL